MPKHSRKIVPRNLKGNPKTGGIRKSQAKGRPNSNAKPGKSRGPDEKPSTPNAPAARDQPPTIPFSPEDAILLVGEGDLSFSRALVEHHYCESVTATVLEATLEELAEKYPQVQENVHAIEADGSKIIYGVDAKKMGPWTKKTGKDAFGLFDRISRPPTPCSFPQPHTFS